MQASKICLIGGTGFVGRNLAAELARLGHQLKVLTRRRERHRELLVFPRLELVEANVHSLSDLTAELGECDVVINTTGILNEEGTGAFTKVHDELPRKLVEACDAHNIARLMHVSALGAGENAPSAYLRSKWAGEQHIHGASSRIHTTIFRPSVIFGPGDSFFNRFAQLLAITPGIFPLASPNTRFQPVYVGDVVDAITACVGEHASFGQTYDLCGPMTYTLRELVEYTGQTIGIERRIWPLSDKLARLQASILERLPGKPFSRDNLLSLQVDSVSENNGLTALGISPTGIDAVVPRYLGAENRIRRNGVFRRFAGR